MQAFSHKRRDCAATALQSRLLCARAYDRTRTHAAFHTHQRLPPELLVHAPRAGRPLGGATVDAEKAVSEAMLLSTRRRTPLLLWLEPALHSKWSQVLLRTERAAISGFFPLDVAESRDRAGTVECRM